jgi:hypothetical protein
MADDHTARPCVEQNAWALSFPLLKTHKRRLASIVKMASLSPFDRSFRTLFAAGVPIISNNSAASAARPCSTTYARRTRDSRSRTSEEFVFTNASFTSGAAPGPRSIKSLLAISRSATFCASSRRTKPVNFSASGASTGLSSRCNLATVASLAAAPRQTAAALRRRGVALCVNFVVTAPRRPDLNLTARGISAPSHPRLPSRRGRPSSYFRLRCTCGRPYGG